MSGEEECGTVSADAKGPGQSPIGLLLVHGMGVQHEGDTLVDMGDPMLDWVAKWLAGHRGSAVALPSKPERSAICKTCKNNDGPMHVHAQWTMPAHRLKSTGETFDVIIAESWWADCLKPPSTSKLALWLPSLVWGVTRKGLAWILIFLVALIISIWILDGKGPMDALPAAFTIAAVSAVGLFLFAPAVLVLKSIPFMASKMKVLLDFLTLWVGDALVYERNPIAAANAKEKIEKDLDWLSRESGRVVVAAHSLGSLLVVDLLARNGRGQVEQLVTFGSAIKLLQRHIRRYVHALDEKCSDLTWVNVYDPVDFIAGPIYYSKNFPRNIRVDNCQSVLQSHSSYPGNAEQFLTLMYRTVIGSDSADGGDQAPLRTAIRRRRNRSRSRRWLIWLTAPSLMGTSLLLLKLGWVAPLADAVGHSRYVPDLLKDPVNSANATGTGKVFLSVVFASIVSLILIWGMRLFFAWWEAKSEDGLAGIAKYPKQWWVASFFLVMAAASVAPFVASGPPFNAETYGFWKMLGFEGVPAAAGLVIVWWLLSIKGKRHVVAEDENRKDHRTPIHLGDAFEMLNHAPSSAEIKEEPVVASTQA